AALRRDDVAAVIVCPSNPYLSIDPILAVPGVRQGLQALAAPIVAVSPLVGGQALKGPAAKLMRELGVVPDSAAIARHYQGLLCGLIIDHADAGEAEAVRAAGAEPLAAQSVMTTDEDRISLAGKALAFAERLGAPAAAPHMAS